jgi:hypothetical protein
MRIVNKAGGLRVEPGSRLRMFTMKNHRPAGWVI